MRSKKEGETSVTVKTRDPKDVTVLYTIEIAIQRHIAYLLVHKGMAPNIDSALALFQPKLVPLDEAFTKDG